jgi:integrase
VAKRFKLIRDNPADEAGRLNLSSEQENEVVTPDKVYGKDEIKKLIDATEPGTVGKIIVMFPALTGVRIGELLVATWDAIDLKAGKFEVRLNMQDSDKGEEPIFKAPKTKSSRRTVPLPRELVHELRLWKLKCPQNEIGLVVVNELGKPFHREQVSNILNRRLRRPKSSG